VEEVKREPTIKARGNQVRARGAKSKTATGAWENRLETGPRECSKYVSKRGKKTGKEAPGTKQERKKPGIVETEQDKR